MWYRSPRQRPVSLSHFHSHLQLTPSSGVASVALRSLHHAAECLTSRREQEEVLQIFTKINKETGWRIAFVFDELKKHWGWAPDEPPPGGPVHLPSSISSSVSSGSSPRHTTGIVNPLFASADFSLPRHPYENVYVPPAQVGGHMHVSLPAWGPLARR